MWFAKLSDTINSSFLNSNWFLSIVFLIFHNVCNNMQAEFDPRTENWWLMKNDKFVVTLLFSYFYFVRVIGPRWMKNKEPFDLRKPLLIYNALQVIVNIGVVNYQLSHTYLGGGYSLYCQGTTFSKDMHAMAVVVGNYWYFWVRIADFLDTIFFVLRKKNRNISSLHVLHHFVVAYDGWYFLKYGSDGHPMLGVIVNACIHIIMYTYYFLAALGPQMRKYLWWKKHVTQLQILQFFVLWPYGMIPILTSACSYPAGHSVVLLCIPQAAIGTILFLNFYYQNYIKTEKRVTANGVHNKVK